MPVDAPVMTTAPCPLMRPASASGRSRAHRVADPRDDLLGGGPRSEDLRHPRRARRGRVAFGGDAAPGHRDVPAPTLATVVGDAGGPRWPGDGAQGGAVAAGDSSG